MRFMGVHFKVARPKHQVLKKYIGNEVILRDETANNLGEAR